MTVIIMGKLKLPKGWEESTIGESFTFLKTASFSRDKMCSESPNAFYIHYGDIHKLPDRILDFDKDTVFSLSEECDIEKYDLLENGDLIIADASEDHEGIAACVEISNLQAPAISGLHTFALRPNGKKIAKGYAYLLIQSHHVKHHLMKVATGISVLGISKKNLSKTPIYYPQLREQKRIAELVRTWDKEIDLLKILAEQYRAQKRGLMQKLLTGVWRL